ncbi:MAG TPA: hypothetical protein VJ654_02890 [Noviherbaspirillum sp.]|nr:hypothetical protein [Noviherbaspirillum sp.]
MSNVTTLSTSTKPAPITWVESLFSRMEAMYGAKFLDMWRGTDAGLVKQLWADEMGKLSTEDLKRGYAALMTRDWPPSLPEYVKMCKPSVDPTVAYYEAVNGMQAREKGEKGQWSHPAVFWAAVQISAFDLKNQSYSQLKTRWEKTLAEEMAKGEWAAVPEPMLALPEPGKSELSREKATKMMHQLGAADVLKPKTNHKLWAERIIKKSKQPLHGLSALQISFAKEALSAKA